MFQMQTIYQPDKPSPMLIAEIQYFMAFSALRKMAEKEKVTMEDARKMNLLLAERFGVRSYEFVFTKPSSCSDHRHEISVSPE